MIFRLCSGLTGLDKKNQSLFTDSLQRYTHTVHSSVHVHVNVYVLYVYKST